MKDPRRRALDHFERLDLCLTDLEARLDMLRMPVTGWEFRPGRYLAPAIYEHGDWRPWMPDATWGGQDASAWFRALIVIPAEFAGQEVLLRLYPGGEGILRLDGHPAYGFDFNHREFRLAEMAVAGATWQVELECYVRDAPDDAIRNDIRHTHRFERADLVVRDRALEGLWYDLSTALDLARASETTRPDLSRRLLLALQHATTALDPGEADPANYRIRAAEVRSRLANEVFDHGHDRPAGRLALAGTCHIDLWYVWPYRESVRKNLRTDLIAADLAARWPDFVFSQSQGKLWADLESHHPEVFARVRDLVAAGRFEPVGDMWVEPDGNIPGGEAYVRQILYGRRFFRSRFGTTSTVCWMPDVFGVGASLPQILVQAGYRLFYTNKQSVWHDTNDFPHTTFHWEGIDGSRIVAHLPPTHFVGKMDAQSLLWQWSEQRQQAEAPEVLYTYGFGDGGGGPTDAMLERAKRLARLDGVAPLRMTRVEDFADDLLSSTRDLPVWADEIYLEMHRGAQTSKGQLKWLNRRCEERLREAELLAGIAAIAGTDPGVQAELDRSWTALLECHFHDGVTGTHCAEAGVEIEAIYSRLAAELDHLVKRCASSLAATAGSGATIVNLSGATAGHVAWAGGPPALAVAGRAVPVQVLDDGQRLAWIADLPRHGALAADAVELSATPVEVPFAICPDRIRSPHYEVEIDNDGRIARLRDLDHDREVLAGPGNALCLYEDRPGRFEAWDIHKEYRLRPIDGIEFQGSEVGACGPLLASLRLRFRIGTASTLTQELILYAHDRRIDLHTEIDWHEERRLLRVEFPLAVRSGRATYEIAFGAIERPTRPTNSFDAAKFEVPLHRWLDLSECGYGVALLNDGKYGGSVHGHVAALSLLKGPRFPDPGSDLGLHVFTYSLLPHAGSWQEAGVSSAARILNAPPRLLTGRPHAAQLDWLDATPTGISLEALKRAEDGDGWILRTVELHGQRSQVSIRLPAGITSALSCTVAESADDLPCTLTDGALFFDSRPFGIRSFRLRGGARPWCQT